MESGKYGIFDLLEKNNMKFYRSVYLLLMFFVIFGCYQHVEGRGLFKGYPPIKGKVVDGVTGQPLEGALVVTQWSKKHGFGLTYHTLSLITETLTDKEGVFSINNTPNDPFVEPPRMVIYKEGYIPWRNDMVFPGGHRTKDYEWNNNVTYKLDVYSDKYSIEQLSDFLEYGMSGIHNKEVPISRDLTRKISGKKYDEIRKFKVNDNKQ